MKLNISYFILFFIFGCFVNAFEAKAQGEKKYVTFSGFVTEGKTDAPLPGAYVINDRAGKGVFTNSRGYFILDVFPGDSILFSYMGFKKQFHIIPQSVSLNYSAVVELREDAKMLKEVTVYPFRTEEEFKVAFMEMELSDSKEREIIEKNYSSENIRRMAANQAMGAGGNYRYAMDQQMMRMSDPNRITMNPFLNTANWVNFIRSVKSGQFADKAWKKAEYKPSEAGGRDVIFKASH